MCSISVGCFRDTLRLTTSRSSCIMSSCTAFPTSRPKEVSCTRPASGICKNGTESLLCLCASRMDCRINATSCEDVLCLQKGFVYLYQLIKSNLCLSGYPVRSCSCRRQNTLDNMELISETNAAPEVQNHLGFNY